MEFIQSLNLGEKVLPHRNPSIAWFWVFMPALLGYLALLMASLNGKPFIGSVEVYDSDFAKLAEAQYPIEVIATGMKWAEGPLWIDNDDSMPYLLYSDTQQNNIYKWEEGKGFFTVGKTMYIPKSGCRADGDDAATEGEEKENDKEEEKGEREGEGEGEARSDSEDGTAAAAAAAAPVSVTEDHCNSLSEPGSSGLARVYAPTLDASSSIAPNPLDMLVCQHGMRSIALQRDNGTRTVVVSHFKGKRLNAPADLAWSPEGHLYFTDPTFGLMKGSNSNRNSNSNSNSNEREQEQEQEQPVSGLYMVHSKDIVKAITTGVPATNVFLIDGKMSAPKGLAFSPTYSKLYVSNADAGNAYWKVFDVNSNGLAHKGRVFYNATAAGVPAGSRGKPGGLKVDRWGNIYGAGPGGVFVLSPEGKLLSKFKVDREITGIAFGTDGRLYMTAEDALLRKWLRTQPAKPPSSALGK
jgi:gluconolactonase